MFCPLVCIVREDTDLSAHSQPLRVQLAVISVISLKEKNYSCVDFPAIQSVVTTPAKHLYDAHRCGFLFGRRWRSWPKNAKPNEIMKKYFWSALGL
jgi:hypothetical protein